MTTAGWQEDQGVRPPVYSDPRSRSTGGAFDMAAFVNRVIDEFEAEAGVRVDRSGREALIRPALPHARDVERALETGALTIEQLEEHLRTVLRNAHDLAGERLIGGLDAAAMQASMRRYCPYVFWC